jgi:hypothetical protein
MMRWTLIIGVAFIGGCIAPNRELDKPVTQVDPKEATIDYWLVRPAVVSVSSDDFNKLFNACERVLRDRLFKIDRLEPRGALITTEPLVSKQFFEFWRNDVVTFNDTVHSSLGTMRRTVRFEISKNDDGTYTASPKVIVEEQASTERQIPSAGQYTMAFGGERVVGSREIDRGETLPQDYWYATGRDAALEKDLARSVESLLR